MENKRGRPANWTPPKGGARYPQYGLKDALVWANKLVAKTHLGPQPSDIVYASVVSSKGATAQIKVSALKQFNLLEGSSQAYSATSLAKAISAAPSEEKQDLYARAALAPAIFKALFDTYHGDEVSIGKLKQRVADLNVHPDKTGQCVSIYVDTMQIAGLVSVDGDKVVHRAAIAEEVEVSDTSEGEIVDPLEYSNESNNLDANDKPGHRQSDPAQLGTIAAPRAIFHVNVNLDASLDTEKLEKHLALLKRYGAI